MPHRASELIIKHLQGDLTTVERIELEEWCREKQEHQQLFEELTDEEWVKLELKELPAIKARIWNTVENLVPGARQTVTLYKKTWVRWVAAACIAGLLFTAGYFWLGQKPKGDAPVIAQKDIKAPASNKARITLTDGSTISLDSVNAGTLATQGNVKVEKNANGEIVYSNSSSPLGEAEVRFNTLYNPRGSKPITLTLSDGTQVWLNAESSLKYPVTFTDNQRKVEITGEAYFEVVHNTAMPFKVALPPSGVPNGNGRSPEGGEVTVLGTHFNVNAYDDEDAIKVTLLEGSVKVATINDGQSTVIKPGQQAILSGVGGTNNDQLSTFNSPDLNAVMAWKNGWFEFDNASVNTVLRQLARWYDLQIEYEKQSNEKIGGRISRDLPLSALIKMLQSNGVKLELKERKLTVK